LQDWDGFSAKLRDESRRPVITNNGTRLNSAGGGRTQSSWRSRSGSGNGERGEGLAARLWARLRGRGRGEALNGEEGQSSPSAMEVGEAGGLRSVSTGAALGAAGGRRARGSVIGITLFGPSKEGGGELVPTLSEVDLQEIYDLNVKVTEAKPMAAAGQKKTKFFGAACPWLLLLLFFFFLLAAVAAVMVLLLLVVVVVVVVVVCSSR